MKELSLFILLFFLLFNSCVEEPISVLTEPSISIIQPLNNTGVSDSISIIIDITSLKEIIRVEVFIDHQLEKVFTKPPYVFFWYVYYYSDGSQHIIEARAYDKDGGEMKSKPVIVNVYRFMPSYLQAFMNSDSAISLNWIDNSKIETGFEIEHALNDSNFSKIAEVDSNVTNYVFRGNFNKSDKHFFRVRAKSQNAVSGYSNIAKAQIILNKPTNVNINFTSDTTATVLWKDNSPFEIGYYLEIRRNNISVFFMNYPANTSRADIQCDFQSGYYYQCIVTARDTFQVASSDPVYKQFSFYTPDSLSVEQISESKVRLKWKNANFFNTKYRIERKINDGNYFEIGTTNPTQLYFENDNLDTANTYFYRVSAFTRVNTSSPTNPIKVGFLPFIAFNKYINATRVFGGFNISKDGNSIIMGDYSICHWFNISSASIIKSFFAPDSEWFDYVDISYDNSMVAAGSDYTKYVKIWNTSDGSLKHKIYIGGYCENIKFHPSKSIIVMASNYWVIVYDYISSAQLYSYYIAAATSGNISLAISNSNNLLAIRSDNAIIKIIDLSNGAVIREFNSSYNFGYIFFSNDDQFIIEYSNRIIRKWNITTGILRDYNLGFHAYDDVTLHPKRNYMVIVGSYIFDLDNWGMINSHSIANPGYSYKFLPDGNRLISRTSYHQYFALWNYTLKWQQSKY